MPCDLGQRVLSSVQVEATLHMKVPPLIVSLLVDHAFLTGSEGCEVWYSVFCEQKELI